MNVEEVYDEPDLVMGKLLINSCTALVLFDNGASHSFISRAFVGKSLLASKMLRGAIRVSSPGGEMIAKVIRPFYIIIFITYIILLECYLHYYINILHVLDDLWDFHTKSLFLAFNIWEAEYPLFLFLLFQEFREIK